MPSPTVYYKATRVDGTDFRTGLVRYEVGKRVRPHPLSVGEDRILCGPGFLHAADVPAETLSGGRWPCRLFEVTGKPSAGFDSRHPHKGGFKELRVLCEVPAHLVFGPNGQAVVRIIYRARQITPSEGQALVTAWDAAWDAAEDAAEDAAWSAAWSAARWRAWSAARDAARDAALAVLVQDLITPEQFQLLYGPWASVIDTKATA